MSAFDPTPESRAQRLQNLHAATLRLFGLLTARQPETALLQQAIESLAGLIGARYGAIGVLDEAGKLTQFVHTGVTAEEAARIGRLPEGCGLLGVVIRENQVLRFDDMGRDPRAAGFPPHHPPMKSLLAAPVAHGGRVYGRVYLSEKRDGAPFTPEDEQLVSRFAEALALAIRFHLAEETLRDRSALLQTITDAMGTYLQSEDWHRASKLLVRFAIEETQSEYGFAGVLAEDNKLRILAHEGATWHTATNRAFYERALKTYRDVGYLEFTNFNNLFGRVITDKTAVLSNNPADDPRAGGLPPGHPPLNSFLGIPMLRGGQAVGMIAVANRPGGYTATERQRLEILAETAAMLYDSYLREQRERRQEDALRQGDARNRLLVEAIPDLLLRIRGDGTYLDYKPAHDFPSYVPPEAFLGRKIADVLPPAIAEEHMALIRRALASGQSQVSRYRLEVDGKPRDYEARIVPAGPDEVLGIVRDVTEPQRTAARLQQLSSAIEQTADSVLITDADGIIEYVNPAFERTTGYTQAEAQEHKPNLVKSGLHDDAFYQRLWQTIREGKPFRDVFVNRRKDGTLYFEEKTITPLKDGAGRTTHFVSTGKNITERMQAEIALRESEERFRSLTQLSSDWYWEQDANYRFTVVTRNEESAERFPSEETLGKARWELPYLDVPPEVWEEHKRTLDARRPFRDLVLKRRDRNGRVRYSSLNGEPVFDARDNFRGYHGTGRDITERMQALETLRANEARLAEAQRMAQLGNWELDLANKELAWSDEIYRIFEFDPAQFTASYEAFLDTIHPDDRERVNSAYTESVKSRTPYDIEHRLLMKDGRIKHVHERCETFYDETGKPLRSVGTVQDITERKLTENKLARLGRILDNSSNEIYVFDAERLRFIQVNRAALNNLGYSLDEMQALTPPDIHPQVDRTSCMTSLELLSSGKQDSVTFETVNRRKDGSTYPVEMRLHLSRHETPPVYVAVAQDITERKRAEEQLNYLAYYDTLTGLPNRSLLLERLKQATLDAERVDRLVAVMFLDLDRFKYINDTLGHHVGDGLLKAVAERLKECVRPGDTISRLGGDEFTIVLANVAHVDDVARVARKLIDSFAQPFRVESRELFTTTSIGITLYPFDERDAEGLLKNADAAMYHAKERGRNTFQYFTAELNVRAERRLRIETALRQALERNELSLHYQPQVDLKTGRLTGMEALARWRHPELGNVSPVEFIPVAEETGLIVPLGEWVLHEACRQIKAWHDTGFARLQVAVNLSGKQLRQKDFPDRVREILQETKLESSYLDLELTESLLMVDTEETAGIMHTLHEMGVSFSVDDFGTGYSSLAYLKRFPIDVLKIDRSFVRDIASDPNDVAIVKTVIAMAHTLGMRVIAEGVETREQLEFLRKQGCDGSQGYYCSMPLSAEEFSELLVDWKRIHADRCQRTSQTQRASRQRRPAKNKSRARARRQAGK